MLRTLLLLCCTRLSSGFNAALPNVKAREASNVLSRMHSEHLACVLDDHTQIKLRKFTSTRFVAPGQCVTCLSLSNIEVDSQQRRRGHARRALATLRKAAHDNDHVLLVENVVSDHMHQLINSLDGAALPGCRPG